MHKRTRRRCKKRQEPKKDTSQRSRWEFVSYCLTTARAMEGNPSFDTVECSPVVYMKI